MLHENGPQISETGAMAVKFGPIRILDVFFSQEFISIFYVC